MQRLLCQSAAGVRGCSGCCGRARRDLLRAAIVLAIFGMALSAFWFKKSPAAVIAIESVAYCATACLYICTFWTLRGKIISGIFLSVLAAGIALLARKTSSLIAFFPAGNFVALLVYCNWNWKLYALAWDWVRRRRARARGAAATAPAPAPPLPSAPAGHTLPVQVEQHRCQQLATIRIDGLPRNFSYVEIRDMTRDFRDKVGRGGFAEVFWGLLDDGTAVAVKRIFGDHSGVEAEFLAEVNIVASLQHRSLVRLIGYGLQGGRYLVYPFFENSSLDKWLFAAGEERRRQLPWPTRRRIALDVARALAYLHHESRRRILHLDIKPANILLDADLLAHVADFGISVSISRNLSTVNTRGRGTPGYMAPEALNGELSHKSDVYSYGMTLLELVGGRRNFVPPAVATTPDLARDLFPRVVRERVARGALREAVDAAMAHVDEAQVEVAVKVALSCVQYPARRAGAGGAWRAQGGGGRGHGARRGGAGGGGGEGGALLRPVQAGVEAQHANCCGHAGRAHHG